MTKKGMSVNIKLFNIVLSTCAKNQQWEIVLKLFDSLSELVGTGVEPSSSTYSLTIVAAIKTKDVNRALKVCYF